MPLVSRDLVASAARRTAGLAVGGVSAVVELGFLLVAVPTLAVAPAAAHAGARRLAEFERRRIERFLGQPSGDDYTGERALRYLGVRWLVGGLGAGVLLLILLGSASGAVMAAQLASGGSLGTFNDPGAMSWYDPITFVLFGVLLAFVSVQGLMGVDRLDRGLARHFLGPTDSEVLRRRVSELTASRADVVAAVTAERRRTGIGAISASASSAAPRPPESSATG